ncbi:MAG: hypothetical protein JW751_24405 [Polyangiaceae bacterium]|nr:hypothetical protein [Polyangiaceae bacterium]
MRMLCKWWLAAMGALACARTTVPSEGGEYSRSPRWRSTAVVVSGAAPSAGAVPSAIPMLTEPVPLARWLDVPARLHWVHGAVFATFGEGLAILRDGELQQDGVISRLPGCSGFDDAVGEVRGIAGAWPVQAFQLRQSKAGDQPGHLVYQWARDRWRHRARVPEDVALLVTRERSALLLTAARNRGGYKITSLDPQTKPPTPSQGARADCPAAIDTLAGAAGSLHGEVLVWGTGCDGEASLELFEPGGKAEVVRWPGFEISTAELSQNGRAFAARIRAAEDQPTSELLTRGSGGWEPVTTVAGTISSVAETAGGIVYLVVDAGTERGLMELAHGTAAGLRERSLTVPSERPIALASGVDGELWVAGDGGLYGERIPRHPWTWWPLGCHVATVQDAKPFHPRRTSADAGCGGTVFLLVESSKVPESRLWRDLFAELGPPVARGLGVARGERKREDDPLGLGSTRADRAEPPQPGPAIVPVVARELDRYLFGFRVAEPLTSPPSVGVGPREEALQALQEVSQRFHYPLLCARPLSFPSERVEEWSQ